MKRMMSAVACVLSIACSDQSRLEDCEDSLGPDLIRASNDLSSTRTDGPPNIVLIVADDLGFETVGAYGGTSYGTPNIDALADAGMRFDFAFSNPSCTPSRVKLMTGKYNLRNYVRFGHLSPGETTIAHTLAQAGYQTMVAGKWQLGGTGGQLPEEAGFDEHLVWNFAGVSDGNDSRYDGRNQEGRQAELPGDREQDRPPDHQG